MSMAQRIRKTRSSQRLLRKVEINRIRLTRATYLDPARMAEVPSVFLVGKRPPLANYPMLWRVLARWVYNRLNWAPDFGIEYQGVFTNESAARHAASAPGMFYMELPLNAELPIETAQWGAHDFPHSEASGEYRNRHWPFIAVSRRDFEMLEAKIEQVARSASA